MKKQNFYLFILLIRYFVKSIDFNKYYTPACLICCMSIWLLNFVGNNFLSYRWYEKKNTIKNFSFRWIIRPVSRLRYRPLLLGSYSPLYPKHLIEFYPRITSTTNYKKFYFSSTNQVKKKGKKMKEKIILRILKIEKKRSFIYLVLETLSNYLQKFYSMQYQSF